MKQVFLNKTSARVLAVIMALTIMFSSMPVYGEDSVVESKSLENMKPEEVFTKGTGTSDDPFVIENITHLKAINIGLDKCYVLGNDIDLEDVELSPIGSEEAPFTGSFDGAGYSLLNFSLNEAVTTNKYVGLFGVMDGASVNDVSLTACDIQGTALLPTYDIYVGALVGKCVDSSIWNVSINPGYVEASHEENHGYVGGVAGIVEGSDITDCVNYAEIEGSSAAGIVHSMNSSSYLNNCINYGLVYGKNHDYGNIVYNGVNDNVSNCLYMKTCANASVDRDLDGVIDITDVHDKESSYVMFDTDKVWTLTSEGIMVLNCNDDFVCSYIESIEAEDIQISINSSKEVNTEIKTNTISTIFGLKYEVEDTSIATVDEYGFIKVIKAGTTTVKVTDVVSGKSAMCILTVNALKQIKMLESSFEYTGKAIEPEDSIYVMGYKDEVLDYGKDYKLEYKNNLHTGTATVKAIGIGDYSGSLETQFYISTKDIAKADLEVDGFFRNMDDAQFGKISLVVKADGQLLKYGKDYTFMYDEWKPIDYTKSVIEVDITFMNGDYIGNVKKKIDLSKHNLTGIKVKGYNGVYDGKPHSVELSGVPSGATVYYKAYGNESQNEFTTTKPYFSNAVYDGVVCVIRKEGYNDFCKTEEVVINKADLAKATVSLSFSSAKYTGKFIHNKMTIYYNGVKLVEDRDYQYVDAGGIYPGKAYVMAEGIGNYEGYTKTLSFTIKPPKSAVPANTSVKLYGHDDVHISWSKVSGACGYQIYYKSSKMSSYKKLGSTTKLYFKKSNLADGLKYTFRVYPCKKFGGKSCRMDDYKATSSITTLKKISTPRVTKSGKNKVKVSWTNIGGETGYQISKSTKKNKTSIVSTYKTTSGKSKVIKATRKKTYYYKVRAYKTVNGKKIYGPWSSVKKYKLK